MTIEEAINWYETKLAVNEAIKLDGPQNDAARLALAALRAQQKQPNEPLTLEELREMDGEPVWTECIIQGSLSCWGYRDEDGVCGYCANFSDDDYGGYWIAYRRKPEQEEYHDDL